MASDLTDFVIYDEEVWTSMALNVTQNINAFNEASNNALVVMTEFLSGQLAKNSFFDRLDPVQYRDPTDTGAVADQDPSQSENISVKLDRRIGPVATTYDAWKKAGATPENLSVLVGEWAARFTPKEMLNRMIAVLVANLEATAGAILDVSGGSTANYQDLNKTNALLGDNSGRIAAYVMHSKAYHDLVGDAITQSVTNVTDVVIYGGAPGTFGRPVIVTDAPALLEAGAPDKYKTLALVPNAATGTFSEARNFEFDRVTGNANLVARVQGEYSYNLDVLGYSYTGAVAPADAVVDNAANWTAWGDGVKDRAGALLISD